jgi:Putative heavy-metal-binding
LGEVVRSTGAIKTMGAGLKAMRQGEVTQYAQLLEDRPKHAIDRLIENARLRGQAPLAVAARAAGTEPRAGTPASGPAKLARQRPPLASTPAGRLRLRAG